jgi:hypothetical protein|eukprot:SAG25_NODE_743_length_5598_cov_5.820149_4_plen_63_part_00
MIAGTPSRDESNGLTCPTLDSRHAVSSAWRISILAEQGIQPSATTYSPASPPPVYLKRLSVA